LPIHSARFQSAGFRGDHDAAEHGLSIQEAVPVFNPKITDYDLFLQKWTTGLFLI